MDAGELPVQVVFEFLAISRMAQYAVDVMTTDGLNSYRVAAGEVLPATEHVREIRITGHKKGEDSGRMERLNCTIRDMEKAHRGPQGSRAKEFCGRGNCNHARRHRALKQVPGEEAGLLVEGAKQMTVIRGGGRHLTDGRRA